MSAAVHLRRLDRAISRTGETITIQRLAVDAAGVASVTAAVTCQAHVRASAPQDIDGGGDVNEQAIIVSATGLGAFGVPARDDRVLIQGDPSNIISIMPIYLGGELVRVNLLCRG